MLLRPVSSLFQVLFETFRIESLQELRPAFSACGGARSAFIRVDIRTLGLLIFFGVCGSVIYLSVFLILTTVSFWFEDRIGIHPPVWNVIAFGRYPLSIYSGGVQFVLCWIIPFGSRRFIRACGCSAAG